MQMIAAWPMRAVISNLRNRLTEHDIIADLHDDILKVRIARPYSLNRCAAQVVPYYDQITPGRITASGDDLTIRAGIHRLMGISECR